VKSLRSRLMLGALLWTIGLVAATHFVVMALVSFARPGIVHWGALSVGAIGLLAAGLTQVRTGLAPFEQLRSRLAAVRQGHSRRVEGLYPSEVQPLVDDLNALLEDRERSVGRAQAKAGDLAHGLKTPLAVLAQEAERARTGEGGELATTVAQQVDRMRRQVDYHLAHARAAASGARLGARSSVAESVEGLVRTLRRLHAERGLVIETQVPVGLAVRVQREDLDEMLGNLLDNACKWTRSRVRLAASAEAAGESEVLISVDDDGPGLDPALQHSVLQRGVRADEALPGSGLGLAIVRDLAELYGGAIALDRSPEGGVRARLRLPTA
jgi:signal transduction histidine kinase